MSLPTLARQLAETVEPGQLLDTPALCTPFAVQGLVPALVAAPGSVEELSAVMAAAAAAGAAVVPWGGGTRQVQGGRPARVDLVVRTGRLASVVEYEPDDLTIAVEAGMTMATLRDTLAPHGQILPVDVALPGRSTIGGALATAADGPRRLGYGTFRDLLIGIRVVEATGRISKAGGMVVKNVSGFDMMKLYTGSHGTLAIIVQANFKLLPAARAAATICCGFDTLAGAMGLADAIHQSQLAPVAAEYLAGIPGLPAAHTLAIWAAGLPAAVERQQRDLAALAAGQGTLGVDSLVGAAHQAFWEGVADFPQTDAVPPGALLLRLSCLPSDTGQALGDAQQLAATHRLDLAVSARALSGVAYLRLGAGSGQAAFHHELLQRWPQTVVLACDDVLRAEAPLWGRAPEGAGLMRRIKAEFDPQGTLNPGRFLV